MLKLDHIMYGVRDLEAGIAEIEDRTGVRAAFGGFHPGNGTCNALISLADRQYLEIIAPDPEQGLGGTLGERLIGQRGPRVRTWAVAARNLKDVASRLKEFKMDCRIVDMNRTRPDGMELAWRVLFASGHAFGDLMPFFIDWRDCRHPSLDAPAGCGLSGFSVTLEHARPFEEVIKVLDVDVTVEESDQRVLRAILDTPNGPVELIG